MTLYALVEDYDNGEIIVSNVRIENQLHGLFEDKESARKHLLDFSSYNYGDFNIVKQEDDRVVVEIGESYTVRRIVPVETGVASKGLWCSSLLEDNENELDRIVDEED